VTRRSDGVPEARSRVSTSTTACDSRRCRHSRALAIASMHDVAQTSQTENGSGGKLALIPRLTQVWTTFEPKQAINTSTVHQVRACRGSQTDFLTCPSTTRPTNLCGRRRACVPATAPPASSYPSSPLLTSPSHRTRGRNNASTQNGWPPSHIAHEKLPIPGICCARTVSRRRTPRPPARQSWLANNGHL